MSLYGLEKWNPLVSAFFAIAVLLMCCYRSTGDCTSNICCKMFIATLYNKSGDKNTPLMNEGAGGGDAGIARFLEHGEIEISNNQVKNAICPFAVGRKGWLYADTLKGAEASAIIYSLMETAKANRLRLDDDLLHLLSILPERAEWNQDFEIDDLLPWSEEMKSWFSAV